VIVDQRIATPGRVVAARLIGVAADVIQIVLFPLFAAGAASPWNDALDLLVALAMIQLVGWHWVFLPSLFAELVPGLDLVPTWTAAVFFATRAKARPPAPAGEKHDFIEAQVVSSENLSPERGTRPSPQPSPAGRGRGLEERG
jgi:hypothetical protein